MGASGHGFHLNSTDRISLTLITCGIIILPINKNNQITNYYAKKFISILSLMVGIGTLSVGVMVLSFFIKFEFGSDINLIVIALHYLIPLLFIAVNGIIIRQIIKELRS